MRQSRLVCILCFLFASIHLVAQPSEQQIKKDVGTNGVIKFSFSKTSGTRQWNKELGNWEYVRGVEITRASGYPGVNLIVIGDAVYQQQTASSYTYWKFRVLENHYEGLPEPSQTEIMKLISTDWASFYGYLFGQTLKIIEAPHLASDPQWHWDSPKNLDVRIASKLEMIWQGINVAVVDQYFTVRLFRDDMKGPWQRFMVTSRDEQTVISQQQVGYDRIRELQKNSLEKTFDEQQAQAMAKSLPSVDVPDFQSATELVAFVHNIMINGDEKQLRAVMLKLFSPRFFESGSTVQLTAYGEQSLRNVIDRVYNGSIRYRDEYCQKIAQHPLNSAKVIYIPSCIQNTTSSISVDKFNVGYVEGKAKQALRIFDIEVSVRTDDEAKAIIGSFSSRKTMCPND